MRTASLRHLVPVANPSSPPLLSFTCGTPAPYRADDVGGTATVDGSNAALQARSLEVEQARQRGEWTVPTVMKLERETNPFLRYHSPDIRKVPRERG